MSSQQAEFAWVAVAETVCSAWCGPAPDMVMWCIPTMPSASATTKTHRRVTGRTDLSTPPQ